MARGVNKVILIGNVGQDPEIKYTQGGMAICALSLATTSVRKDRDGNVQEQTQWHRIKFFGKAAEIVGEHVKKGSQLYVEGSIKYDKFTGQDGVEKYITEIMGDDFQFMGGNPQGNGQQRQAPSRPAPQRQAPARPQRQAPQQDFGADFADDDIPF